MNGTEQTTNASKNACIDKQADNSDTFSQATKKHMQEENERKGIGVMIGSTMD